MKSHFHVVQYFDSPSSTKGRNVAVLGFNGWRCDYRAMGVDGDKIEPAYFQSISKKTRDCEWVYREWVNWFDGFAQIESTEQFNKAVDRLKSNKSGFGVSEHGEIEIIQTSANYAAANAEFAATMDKLFKQYVRVPRISPIILFDNQVSSIFSRSEIAGIDGFVFFNEPAIVEMVSEEPNDMVTLEFSHLLSGDRPIGFHTLVLKGAKQKSLSPQAERIALNFNNAVRTGYLQRDRCILLCDQVQKKHRELMDSFSGIATVLDVFDDSTPGRIREMCRLP